MELAPLNEDLPHVSPDAAEAPTSSESRRHMLLGIVAIVLLVITLFGVMQTFFVAEQLATLPLWRYYANIALIVLPLMILAAVLVAEAKLGERLATTAAYQSRLDQLENRLAYREQVLKLISDHQPAATMIFDRHNRFFFVNDTACQWMNKKAGEVIGQPPIRVLPNEQAKKLEIRLAEARAADNPIEIVDRATDAHGNTRFLRRHYESISELADMSGCVMLREEDLTSLIVEKERREQMLRQVIETLVAVVDRRDPYATGHSSRVGQLSKAIAMEMELSPELVEAAEIAGSLMNFGKVLVSRRILTKTTALTPDELQRVRDSILTSADILAIIGFDGPVVPTLRQVLERYDGKGVPEGLKGEDILITARIVSASNAFVAFVSPRAHRDGLSFKEALNVMANDSGKAFDERVLVAMSHYIENRPNKIDWLVVKKPVGAVTAG